MNGWLGMLKAGSVSLVMVVCLLGGWSSASAAEFCGSFERTFGPWDYNDTDLETRKRLRLVEGEHFGQDVFRLQGRTPPLAGNISYTLRNFPNHPQALDAISRLALREGTTQPSNAEYTVDCYFERAIRWRPRDATVRLVHAIHHYRFGRVDEAIAQAREGLKLAPNNVELHYNLGLFLVRKGDYAGARRHAQQAYRQGYPLAGLREQLKRAGQWTN